MTAQELLICMASYHEEFFCKKLIIICREQNLLLVNKDSEDLLNELTLFLESSLFFVNRKVNIRQRAAQRLRGRRQKAWRKIFKNPGNATKLLLNRIKYLRVFKKALVEVIEENQDLVSFILVDALEDIGLSRAIEEGENSAKVSREEVFKVLIKKRNE